MPSILSLGRGVSLLLLTMATSGQANAAERTADEFISVDTSRHGWRPIVSTKRQSRFSTAGLPP